MQHFNKDDSLRASIREAIQQHNDYVNGTDMSTQKNTAADETAVPEQKKSTTRILSGVDSDGKNAILITEGDEPTSKVEQAKSWVKAHKKHFAVAGGAAALVALTFFKVAIRKVADEIEEVVEDDADAPNDSV